MLAPEMTSMRMDLSENAWNERTEDLRNNYSHTIQAQPKPWILSAPS
jgi:hypothetical protein